MGRPGTKITSFPKPTIENSPVQPFQLTTTPGTMPPTLPAVSVQPLGNSTLPEVGHYPPASEEPITFPDGITIDELIEHRRIVGAKSPIYWAAFDEIQRKRDKMYLAHHLSQP